MDSTWFGTLSSYLSDCSVTFFCQLLCFYGQLVLFTYWVQYYAHISLVSFHHNFQCFEFQ